MRWIYCIQRWISHMGKDIVGEGGVEFVVRVWVLCERESAEGRGG